MYGRVSSDLPIILKVGIFIIVKNTLDILCDSLSIRTYLKSIGYNVNINDLVSVDVNKLTHGSNFIVEVLCDNPECPTKLSKNITYKSYNRSLKSDGSYYCRKCSMKLFGSKKAKEKALKNGKSFADWCLNNNRLDILKRWDFELNNCSPYEVTYGVNSKKFYFKCPEGKHKSQEFVLNSITAKIQNDFYCTKCSSFAQFGINTFGEDFLEKYWDYEKNDVDPWDIFAKTDRVQIWIKCKINSSHKSYITVPYIFTTQHSRCPICNMSKGEYRILTYLDSMNVEYLHQKGFFELRGVNNGQLSYDFYIPCINTLVEYQGEQHEKQTEFFHKTYEDFEIQKLHDKLKYDYAINNDYKILEIWYYEYDKIEKILDSILIGGELNCE